jgi:hypothetical protein
MPISYNVSFVVDSGFDIDSDNSDHALGLHITATCPGTFETTIFPRNCQERLIDTGSGESSVLASRFFQA